MNKRQKELTEQYEWYGPHLVYLGLADDFYPSRANLMGADLRGTNLRGADLREANLRGADLRVANLREANLREANLREANLRGAKSGSVCRMDFGGWSICIRGDKTSIGCKTMENSFWLRAEPKDVKSMDNGAQEWWAIHGEAIKATIKCVMEKAR